MQALPPPLQADRPLLRRGVLVQALPQRAQGELFFIIIFSFFFLCQRALSLSLTHTSKTNSAFYLKKNQKNQKAADEWDPAKRHELERSAVREVVCGLCDERQGAAASCRSCGVAFGSYVCLRCCFFDDVDRGQYHCDDCGICRVGGRHRFFHCQTCSCCYSTSLRGNHVCVENSMRSAVSFFFCLIFLF